MPLRIVKIPMSVNEIAIMIFGIRNSHLLSASNGMKNIAGKVPIPKASMERTEENNVPLPRAFVNPR